MTKHFIAMSGNLGCLPDHCHAFEKRLDALQDLIDLFDLPPYGNRANNLRETGFTRLDEDHWPEDRDIRGYGAEYAQIQECNCGHPEIHGDD